MVCDPFFQVNAKVEARLVVQALRVNTLSKLTFSDSKRFDALVRDIFPGVDFKGVEYAELADALRAAAQESNLMVMETQVSTGIPILCTQQALDNIVSCNSYFHEKILF